MTKHELGQKHLCTNCGVKFYDLTRTPPTCPECETVVEPVVRARPTRSAAKPKPKPVETKPAATEETAPLADANSESETSDDDDASDDVIEDVSELGEDEADVAAVVPGDEETT